MMKVMYVNYNVKVLRTSQFIQSRIAIVFRMAAVSYVKEGRSTEVILSIGISLGPIWST